MQIIILLLVCTAGVVSSTKDCFRSGAEQDTVSYKNDQPLQKQHRLAMDKIKKLYGKNSKELGSNPFTALEVSLYFIASTTDFPTKA